MQQHLFCALIFCYPMPTLIWILLGFLRRDDWLRQPGLPHRVVPLWLDGLTAQAQGQVVLPQVPSSAQEKGPIVT